jgi:hypothetical protein
VKPEPTFGRTLRAIGRWWWLIGGCTIAIAALAVALPVHRFSDATASARIHKQDTTVSFSYKGDPQPETSSQSAKDLIRSDFIDPQVAETAAEKLGGVTGGQLMAGLGFTPLTGTDVQLRYSGSSRPVAERRLEAYVETLVASRRAEQTRVLQAAAEALSKRGGTTDSVRRLETAAASVEQQIYPVGGVTSTPPRSIPGVLILGGGGLAGAILGTLIALALTRGDSRIRSADELRLAGVRAIEVDAARNPPSVEALRVLVEVAGLGASRGAVAVMAPTGKHSALALALASSFVSSGRPTTLLSDSGVLRSGENEWTPVSEGAGAVRSLAAALEAIERGRPSEVVVIDGPGLMDDPEALLSSAVANVTVLAIRPGESTWQELERSLELLEDAVLPGLVRVCVDRTAARPLAGVAARPRASRVRDAVRVTT